MLEPFFDQYAQGFAYSKRDDGWCYEDGCLYRGLLELHLATGDPIWRDHLLRLINHQVGPDGALRGFRVDEYNIDNILAGRVLFDLAETENDRFAQAADQLMAQLAAHPRTAGGNYWHKQIYPHQIWLDGLYMGLPFQIEYGLTRNRPELVDDALDQTRQALAIMGDAATGLYYHGYDDSRVKAWSDPETGLSESFWGRAVGWLAMALIDIVALLPETYPARAEMVNHCQKLADSLLRHRTASGLWLQVMDQPELPDNYEEISGSAMFTYFLLRTAA